MKKRVLFWGAGTALGVVSNYFDTEKTEFIGVVDKKLNSDRTIVGLVYNPEQLRQLEFDYLMISSFDYYEEICEEAVKRGVNRDIILSPYFTESQMIKVYDLLSEKGLSLSMFFSKSNKKDDLKRGSGGQVNDERLESFLKNNREYKNKYEGNRCFVLGTGPSLANQKIEKLKDEIVFTVDMGFHMNKFDEIHSNFHIMGDPLYFNISDDEESNKQRADALRTIGKTCKCFFRYYNSINFVEKYHLSDSLDINYFECDMDATITEKTIEYDSLVACPRTVVLDAAMIATYMGFKEIYLLGCDNTDILSIMAAKLDNPELEQSLTDGSSIEKIHKIKALRERPMEHHFFGQWKKFQSFRVFNNLCKRRGVKLINATEGGIMDNIERANFEDVLS